MIHFIKELTNIWIKLRKQVYGYAH